MVCLKAWGQYRWADGMPQQSVGCDVDRGEYEAVLVDEGQLKESDCSM